MIKLTLSDVEKLGDMAKIELTEQDKKTLLEDANNILEHVSNISDFKDDVDSTSNYFSTSGRTDNLDNVLEFEREILLSNIPKKSNENFVIVPKVIKK